jgi:hypothetical protein
MKLKTYPPPPLSSANKLVQVVMVVIHFRLGPDLVLNCGILPSA